MCAVARALHPVPPLLPSRALTPQPRAHGPARFPRLHAPTRGVLAVRGGRTVVWPAFTSTTVDQRVAEAFGGGGGSTAEQQSCLFEIILLEWCDVSDVSVFPGEREILVPAFTSFAVLSVSANGGSSGVLRVRLQQQKREAPKRETAVKTKQAAAVAESGDSPMDLTAVDKGPLVITDASPLRAEAGVADVLQRQLLKFDPHADVLVRTDPRTGRVWGRATFTSSAAVARACAVLHGSIVCRDRQLRVQAAPMATDALPLRCRVLVRLTAVCPSDTVIVECGSPSVQAQVLASRTGSKSSTADCCPVRVVTE